MIHLQLFLISLTIILRLMLKSDLLEISEVLLVHYVYLMWTEEEVGWELLGSQGSKKLADQWRDLCQGS